VTCASDQSGFSLVEVLVAAVILVLGATTAFSLMDTANRSISANSARIGGTNLARELTEYARATDYDLLAPGQVVPALRARTTIAGTLTGGTWTIARRGVTYAVTASACTFDDPKDGLSATPPPNACPAVPAVGGAPASDVNPDDFRKVRFDLSWTVRNRSGKTSQVALVVNPAGGLGPRITVFDQPGDQVTGDSYAWDNTAGRRLTSTPAAAVHWTTDDGKSSGDAAGGATAWSFTWNFGPAFSTTQPWVRDGTYNVQTQAFDSRGVPGEAKIVTVSINRHPPGPVPGFVGGWNKTKNVVDLRWSRYDERDLQGYVVRRNGTKICPASGVAQDALTCTDTSPPTGSDLTYQVFAVDCANLAARTGCDRESPVAPAISTSKATASAFPDFTSPPTGLTATVVDGLPRLTWTAPGSVPAGPIRFYRVYREDGTGLDKRYDFTLTSATNYTDPNPGDSTAHTYWVTAVDQNFTESPVSASVNSPPVS
jgi:prepilin-type N-terminal cleavage/methylation domain-containing protein